MEADSKMEAREQGENRHPCRLHPVSVSFTHGWLNTSVNPIPDQPGLRSQEGARHGIYKPLANSFILELTGSQTHLSCAGPSKRVIHCERQGPPSRDNIREKHLALGLQPSEHPNITQWNIFRSVGISLTNKISGTHYRGTHISHKHSNPHDGLGLNSVVLIDFSVTGEMLMFSILVADHCVYISRRYRAQ